MKSNKKVIGTVVVGLGAWFLARYFFTAIQKRELQERKRLKREATHEWEGEGGALVEPKRHFATPT